MAILGFGFNASAQSHECEKHQSNYGIRLNQALQNNDTSQYIAAYPFWKLFAESCPADDKDCPCQDKKHWNNGIKILKVMIGDPSVSDERRQTLRDSLYMLHETILKNFGASHEVYRNYGLDQMRDRTKIREAFENFEKSLNDSIEGVNFEDITFQSLQGSFSMAYTMVRAEWEDCNWLVNHYLRLSDIIDMRIKQVDAEDKGNWDVTRQTLEKYAEVCMSCTQLDEILADNIAKLPEDCEEKNEIVTRYLNLLERKKCTDSENFKTLAVMSYDCGKTHEAAHKLALMYFSDKNYSKAYSYVKEAIELDTGKTNTARYQHDAAKIAYSMGSYSAAISHARTAVASGDAKANKVIGDCIAASSSTCGNTTIKKKSVFWLASDYYAKAGYGADHFKANYPTINELFGEDLKAGKSYTVPCYGESTKIRSK